MLRGFTSGLNGSHLEAGQVQLKIEDVQLDFGGVTYYFPVL